MDPPTGRPEMKQFRINVTDFTLDDFRNYLKFLPPVSISEEARGRLNDSRRAFEDLLKQPDVTIYGVHTGFGKLGNVRIEDDEHAVLQRNLVRSHAVGVGPPLEPDAVRLTLLLKVISLCQGYSGVRPEVVDLLVACLNGDALPVVPSQGSVGASGDLAPLAHVALALMGEGDMRLAGEQMPAARALKQLGLTHLEYEAKEGLSLLNGTQLSTAVGILALGRLQNLVKAADIVGALSLDGLMGSPRPFRPEVHALKRHGGQQASAANLYSLMQGSTIRESHREDAGVVQDMYSMRCMPQVHGACRESLTFAGEQLILEA
ncbi:MAG: aromatic amino acid lyase, partial [Candidatus Neomarinimicrobiota bacterium]